MYMYNTYFYIVIVSFLMDTAAWTKPKVRQSGQSSASD